MDIFKVVAFTIISLVIILIIKEQRPEMAVVITIFCSVALLIFVIFKLQYIVELLDNLAMKAGVNKAYLEIIIKIMGIAYIIEFCKNICIDSGSSALASKVEIAGKVIIITLTLPIITGLVDTINKFL